MAVKTFGSSTDVRDEGGTAKAAARPRLRRIGDGGAD